MTKLIVDAGPLVAAVWKKDPRHKWVTDLLAAVAPPLRTCEAVISEACFLVRGFHGGQDIIMNLLAQGVLRCDFHLSGETEPVRGLMRKFADVPMSLADACLVRMTEQDPRATILTFDSDFRIYRRNQRQVVPTLMP